MQRHIAAADGGAAGAAVGLDDVAVDPYRALAQELHVHNRAQRAADQALDLHRPPVLLAAGRVTLLAIAGRAREHAVLEVTQPVPRPRIHIGTDSSIMAVQIDLVEPIQQRRTGGGVMKPGEIESRAADRGGARRRGPCRHPKRRR